VDRPHHRLGDRVVTQEMGLVAHVPIVRLAPGQGVGVQEFPPEFLAPAVGLLLSDGHEELAQEAMDPALHLDELARRATTVASQRLRDQSQAHPLVRLPARHGPLGDEDQLATFPRRIIQQLQQLHAAPGHTVAQGRRISELPAVRSVPTHGVPALEIEFAEGAEVLLPLVDEVTRSHHDRRAERAAYRDGVGDGQRHVGLPHPHLVREHHARLAAEPVQDLDDLGTLALLIGPRNASVEPPSQQQFLRWLVDRAHGRHRSSTRSQNLASSALDRPGRVPTRSPSRAASWPRNGWYSASKTSRGIAPSAG
jgi:hypothetical protein